MRRILICFGYKGTGYAGYQKQPGKNTIQEKLENAIQSVTKEKITVFASGRTDAGVHAIKQYAHFDTQSRIKTEKIVEALNTFLPQDIRVFSAKEVDENFNARFNAKKKTYIYVFSTQQVLNPLFYDMATELKYKLDFDKVEQAMNMLKGEHNFKAFCSSGSSVENFERTIFDFSLQKQGDYLVFKVTGNGFLYNMVRIMIGTIVDVGRGKLELDNIQKMFETGERKYGGKTVSANGLYLYDVEYL